MDWLRQIPIGQFVDGKAGWLRWLDPRLKLGWVLMFLLTPVLAGPVWRVSLLLLLLLITLCSGVPVRVWWRSLALLTVLAAFAGLLAHRGSTGGSAGASAPGAHGTVAIHALLGTAAAGASQARWLQPRSACGESAFR